MMMLMMMMIPFINVEVQLLLSKTPDDVRRDGGLKNSDDSPDMYKNKR
jgi:hypothetical protein